jgi:hypothetical protein
VDSQAEAAAAPAKRRERALTHAYGFVSRGNRGGGFKHIFESIAEDVDPPVAWAWYFERMLAWNDSDAALFFAQDYVHELLCHGEKIAALKLILRCRLLNEQWKPRREDMPLTIAAAQASGNTELAAVLKRL